MNTYLFMSLPVDVLPSVEVHLVCPVTYIETGLPFIDLA